MIDFNLNKYGKYFLEITHLIENNAFNRLCVTCKSQ